MLCTSSARRAFARSTRRAFARSARRIVARPSLPRSLVVLLLALVVTRHAIASSQQAAQAPGVRDGSPAEAAVVVAVDERIELLTIVARLAGAREFRMDNAASPYATRVESHFGRFRDHPAIAAYIAIRRDHGASYDAIPSLALHLDAVPTLAERIPFDQAPERLDRRWDLAATRAFLVELRAFAAASDARGFFDRERPFYRRVAEAMAPPLTGARAVEWFDRFFGVRPGATYVVIPGLLCGGGNYGVGVRFPDGAAEEIRPVLGCHRWDAEGLPIFNADDVGTYVHELCHSYTNQIVDRHREALRDGGSRLYPLVARRMVRMAYGSWETMIYETFVRASVLRYLAEMRSPAAAAEEAKREVESGFTWVPEVAEALNRYASHRDRYPTLDAFVPEIASLLSRIADRMVAEAAARERLTPRLVTIAPAAGAVDVDPSLDRMVLQFDRPMQRKSWSFVGSKESVPEIIGTPSWDGEGRILTATIRLVPGRTYRFSLNSDRFTGFRAEDGTPLEPVDVTFSVKGL